MSEVPVRLPGALGVFSRCCLSRRGGSSRQSDVGKLEGRYGAEQINLEQKSVVMA